jgi:penicillin amidase
MRKLRNPIQYTLIVFLALSLLPIGAYVFMHSRLPDVDGAFYSTYIRGLVRVVRDRWGVPHISAENGSDAYFAYGFTIAQDRLFQMELHRRIARGELAELFGPSFLNYDRQFRTLLFRYTAERYLERADSVDPEALKLLDAFLEGINYFIEREPLPIEFTLLGIKPRRFTRLDCISMVCYMAYSFAYGINTDSLVSMLKRKYPHHNVMELFPGYTREKPVTIMESQAFYKGNSDIGIPRFMVQDIGSPLARFLPNIFRCFITLNSIPVEVGEGLFTLGFNWGGSNSWVIAPSRSASGSAILANDAHVALSNPGIWYEAHIRYGDHENYGYHLPLLPFPMFAHNRGRGWAITMFENDDMDLYYETFHPQKKYLVQYRGNWVKAKKLKEVIKVRGGDDDILEIRITPHGPIISDFLEGYEGKPVSLFWVCHRPDNPVLDIMYRLSISRTMVAFREAISRLAAPGLNFSYVDSSGNIAWWAAGRLPIRPRHINSKEILDGSSGRDEIRGYLPFEKNPHLINPVSGIIVTANNKSTMRPVGPIRDIEGYWVPTDRAARIVELLSARERWSIEDLRVVQTDIKSIAAPSLVAALVGIIEGNSHARERFNSLEESAYRELKSWDYRYDIRSRGATIYNFITYHILKESIEDELGREHFLIYCNLPEYWNFLKAFISDDKSLFWDDINTPEKERREHIIERAYRSAIGELEDRYGSNIENWQWGSIHTIEYIHPIGLKRPMNLLFNIGPLPAPGETRTINRLSSHFGKHDYKVVSVPSFRRLIDYRDLRHSFSILPSGNSGNLLTQHYDDQVEMFLRGEYRVICFTPDQIERDKMHEMIFLPKK